MPATRTDYSKIQIICALFADSIGDDLYYARQIKESIEATLPDRQDDPAAFLAAAQRLADQMADDPDAFAIGLIPARDPEGFSILTLRAQLLEALKKTCRFRRPLLVLTGLKEAICPKGKRWTARRKQEYQDAIDFARAFCHSRARPSSHLNLVIY
ncbi:hypothetical protein [Pelagicoccus sp. SDUM812003]|uniref:hypothetical protein n=1 Tax=Pelagicoccus sp. SDUM812003 TaxID=3041267 RepID=UPI00280F7901|nr:hypothetical protein [Pelagicoccus sp. SDUM812003]MDQ8202499.1 hypothetical protein [Pelagicoccus sp. SDUM812003]